MENAIKEFVNFYENLSLNNLDSLKNVYSEEIIFRDPIHSLTGIQPLKSYFLNLMENVETISFDIHQVTTLDKKATVEWIMNFTHPKFNSGKKVSVHGVSVLTFDTKIKTHRDYFDLGEMVYEHIPFIGRLIKWIKRKI